MTPEALMSHLDAAIAAAPTAQQALVAAVDEGYTLLEEAGEGWPDDAITGIRVRLAHAESLIVRYFGM
jgi:hypothetical protein